jgi:hypothetical protein
MASPPDPSKAKPVKSVVARWLELGETVNSWGLEARWSILCTVPGGFWWIGRETFAKYMQINALLAPTLEYIQYLAVTATNQF